MVNKWHEVWKINYHNWRCDVYESSLIHAFVLLVISNEDIFFQKEKKKKRKGGEKKRKKEMKKKWKKKKIELNDRGLIRLANVMEGVMN